MPESSDNIYDSFPLREGFPPPYATFSHTTHKFIWHTSTDPIEYNERKENYGMKLSEALQKNLIRVGQRVRCNGDASVDLGDFYYTGKVTAIKPTSLTIKRDDTWTGTGFEGGWYVSCKNPTARIEFMQEKCCVCGGTYFCTIDDVDFCKKCVTECPECTICGSVTAHGTVCKICTEKFYVSCTICHSVVPKENSNGGYCNDCLKFTNVCVDCGNRHLREDLFVINVPSNVLLGAATVVTLQEPHKQYEYICGICYRDNYLVCRCCGAICKSNTLSDVRGRFICNICIKNDYKLCECCSQLEHVVNIVTRKGKTVCQQCAEHYKPRIVSKLAGKREVIKTTKMLLDVKHLMLKKLNQYNEGDVFLAEIVQSVGAVLKPIYLYGMNDLHHFSISVSPALFDTVKDLFQVGFSSSYGETYCILTPMGMSKVQITEATYPLALGISSKLRKEHRAWVVDFIKKINEMRV